MTHAIAIDGLHYRAGRAFEIPNLTLRVPAGAIYGFLGPNGSGKTTTIRLVLGLLRPLSGEIRVLGREVPRDIVPVLARTGYVPEQPHLDATLTVAEAVQFHAAFYATWDQAWAERLLRDFELDRSRLVGKLSKGQKGKLMMLLALAQRPDLLMLDEPTDGLDPVVRRDMLSALLDYVAQHGATVFMSSHLIHELERICDWVAVMDRGALASELPMEQFKGGIKRLRVAGAPPQPVGLPFTLLARVPNGTTEAWVVSGWRPEMTAYFETGDTALREVIDLDLEEGFVELLRAARRPAEEA
jgi:ABC-2 type transport system ATP-binding protein